MRRAALLAPLVLFLAPVLALSACDAQVRNVSTGADDGVEHRGDGGGGAGGGGDAVPVEEDPAGELAMCPPPPGRPDGLRDGSVPPGAPDAAEARAIFQRASHEVGHLVSALLDEAGHDTGDLFAFEGDTILAQRDGEALLGTVARDSATGRICAAIRFGAWTGGHGGWGLSALDGTMLVLIDGGATTAVGRVGLVESGPLDGAALADVHVEHDGELLAGSVDAFEF